MMEQIHEQAGATFCADTSSLNPVTGATHRYGLVAPVKGAADTVDGTQVIAWLPFQDGNPADVGRNGFFNEEALLAVQQRLQGFQKGPFACPENDAAIEFIQKALDALEARQLRVSQTDAKA
jgi:hypothetical protein